MWLKTPDGKLVYAHHAEEEDSFMAVQDERNNSGLARYFRAIEYLENNIDFPPGIEDGDIVLNYVYHKQAYSVILIILTVIDIWWSLLGFFRQDKILENIIEINGEKDVPGFFIIFLKVSLCLDLFAYWSVFIFAVFSLYTDKVKYFSILSTLWVFQVFSAVMLCYIHQLYLAAFLLRTVFYIYTRLVISHLHTLLLMPID